MFSSKIALFSLILSTGCAFSSKSAQTPNNTIPTLVGPGFSARIPIGSTVWSAEQLADASAESGQSIAGVVELPGWGHANIPRIVVVEIMAEDVNPE